MMGLIRRGGRRASPGNFHGGKRQRQPGAWVHSGDERREQPSSEVESGDWTTGEGLRETSEMSWPAGCLSAWVTLAWVAGMYSRWEPLLVYWEQRARECQRGREPKTGLGVFN